ncbi:MAG: pyrroline-5-carboxylate reductase [Candidatus Omnitrophica bacterium]|nr:pyrroline-5-carboxylate reductase [Candidatus Omnitrophota bacterium]
MRKESRIGFIGSGVMAEAMIKGMLRESVISASQIIASGPRQERGKQLAEKYGIAVTINNAEAVDQADIVVLSLKPQMLSTVLEELSGKIMKDALVLSIVAGATIEKIELGLNHKSVVRSMPNTPAQIGEGITVWTASPDVKEEQREHAKAILNALGEELFVEDEDFLDMATAVSGTGPAYVFLFLEAMVDAAVHLGFPRYMAEKLVLQTVHGSTEYIREAPDHLARLRNQVTSPGGTSAEALYYLERAGFRTAISRAIWAAYQRSISLGTGSIKKRLTEGNE